MALCGVVLVSPEARRSWITNLPTKPLRPTSTGWTDAVHPASLHSAASSEYIPSSQGTVSSLIRDFSERLVSYRQKSCLRLFCISPSARLASAGPGCAAVSSASVSVPLQGHFSSPPNHCDRFCGQVRVSYAALTKKPSCACWVCQMSLQVIVLWMVSSHRAHDACSPWDTALMR